ncbi:MAG TPA: cytidylate kinase-like family protein [Solirubrobacteraceae bacterium]|nr:cytidylate kinase-like family protein [Solirubrobacteraceae bacterium]
MGARVITISCSDGAGGEEVALAVGAALRFPVISEEILSRAAAEAGVSLETVADVERRRTFMGKLVGRLVPSSPAASAPGPRHSLDAQMTAGVVGLALPVDGAPRLSSDELRGKIRSAIDEYMAHGDVVILAHAAAHSLSGRAGVLRVFVTGSPEVRAGRIAASRLLRPGDAARFVRAGDANRADYLKRFYGIEHESPDRYDLVLDTDELTVEDAAQVILAAAEST